MRLWFSRASEISIRDQLVTPDRSEYPQRRSGPRGQRLPSTRDLARRFHLHPNTISASYRQLAHQNWVEFRKGSGIYVREPKQLRAQAPELDLDQLIASFLHSARQIEGRLSVVRSRLRQWLELQPPDHFLLIEPDQELARIVVTEMRRVLTLPVKNCGLDECKDGTLFEGAVLVAVSLKAKTTRDLLSDNPELLVLHLRSAGDSLAAYLPAPSNALVGVASRWPTFLKTAHTMLVAAGFDPDCLVLRDSSKPNWRRGLKQISAVVCDSLTAEKLDGIRRVLTFPLLAESSLKELLEYEEFIRSPLTP